MFDDIQPPKSGTTPPNLPLGEPEDIFERTESGQGEEVGFPPQSITDPTPSTTPLNTALDAGVLRPKASPAVVSGEVFSSPVPAVPTPSPRLEPSSYTVQTPPAPLLAEEQRPLSAPEEAPFTGRKFFVFVATILIAGILGFGSFWIYTSFIQTDLDTNTFSNGETETEVVPINQPANVSEVPVNTPTSSNVIENNILFGEPVDTDSDGILDVDEARYRTDTLNWDTDGDGLSDGDEVLIWKTNPLVQDTDGDGYTDTVEIKNGYNPLGEGKLFAPPTSTPETMMTTSTTTTAP
jgi:hypothetical protein